MTAIADRPTPTGAESGQLGAVRRASERARGHLLGLQDPAGWWKGELATNVTMDAEDLLLREFLGIRQAAESWAAARWIRSQQREDGTWGRSTAVRPSCPRPWRRTSHSSCAATIRTRRT